MRSRDPIVLDERRRRRSENPLLAMQHQLTQVAEDYALGACIIATEDGRLFAKASNLSVERAEELAAWAAECHGLTNAVREERGEHAISVHEFWAFDQALLVMISGAISEEEQLGIYRTILGTQRIERTSPLLASA